MHHLSKSRLISAWQCAKRLWLEINDPDEKLVTPQMQRAFAIGHQAGDGDGVGDYGGLFTFEDGVDWCQTPNLVRLLNTFTGIQRVRNSGSPTTHPRYSMQSSNSLAR